MKGNHFIQVQCNTERFYRALSASAYDIELLLNKNHHEKREHGYITKGKPVAATEMY